MTTLKDKTIGQIVADDYRTAQVFSAYKIDFCCRGNRTIHDVCDARGLSESDLQEALQNATKDAKADAPNYNDWELDLLVDYIEKKHHRYVRRTIPNISMYLDKLCKVHGERHPELFEVRELFTQSVNDLTLHMRKEENILFPVIRAFTEAELSRQKLNTLPPFGSVSNPINTMMAEHDNEGSRFRKIEALTNNYTPPPDGCTTYRVAYALLAEFEADLHQHIHLENNILFPRALKLETDLIRA